MSEYTRREFLKVTGSTFAVSSIGLAFPFIAKAAKHRVVVVGGGVGGMIVAKYLAKGDSSIEVTVVEPKAHHHT